MEPRQDWARCEVPVDACSHNNVHQFAGFNDFRVSQYKCEDCGAVEQITPDPQNPDPISNFGEVL